jgi:UDP-N-acetylmuramate--alanine ligase
MNLNNIHTVYLIGIGGIGMSALARYFNSQGKKVEGYDKTPTSVTDALVSENIKVYFEDSLDVISDEIKNAEHKNQVLVIVTPAIPYDHIQLNYFKNNDYIIYKRSEILGLIVRHHQTIAIAGTHGKTTVSTMVSHILTTSELKCNAFLGGISQNYNTNLILSPKSNNYVVEADEFDRSFLKLFPHITLITSIDADHLDIYSGLEEIQQTFSLFANQTQNNGFLVHKKGLPLHINSINKFQTFTYSLNEKADFYASDIKVVNNKYNFTFNTTKGQIKNVILGTIGLINVENAVGALAVCYLLNVDENSMKKAVETFRGVERRFQVHINNSKMLYIDDYAHHPEEIKALITSIRNMYPDKKIAGIFQPHLFSRTRDLADDFAKSLSLLDELFLLDIYPARELPIKGVTSEIIFEKVKITNKRLCKKELLMQEISDKKFEILLTIGAGDVTNFVNQIKETFDKQ